MYWADSSPLQFPAAALIYLADPHGRLVDVTANVKIDSPLKYMLLSLGVRIASISPRQKSNIMCRPRGFVKAKCFHTQFFLSVNDGSHNF